MRKWLFIFFLVVDQWELFGQDNTVTNLPQLPDIIFRRNSTKLTKKHRVTLGALITIANKFTSYSIVTEHFFSCNTSYNEISYKQINKVVGYLLSRGLDTNRFYCGFTHSNKPSLIAFRLDTISVTDEPPPHPNLRKKEVAKEEQQ